MNHRLLVCLPKIFVKNLLRNLGVILFMTTAFSANADTDLPELPEGLVQAIRSAMQAHPDVMAANSQMLSAKSQVEAGGYRWYPKAEVAVRTGERGDRYSTVGLNQTLWDFGRLNADFEAAKAGELAAFSGKNFAMQSIGMAAAVAYLDVARAREQKAVAEENVNEHRKLHFSVQKRNDGGIGSRSDVSLTTSRLQQARAMEKQWEGAVSRSEAAYLSVIGAPVDPGNLPLVKSWQVAGEQEGLIARVVERSPSLQKLREEVKVAEATVDSKKAQLFPTLYARVDNTHYFGSGPFDNDTRFSVNFQWQNDVALTQRFQVEAAQHMVTSAQYALAAEERVLVQAASNYWADYITAISRSEELNKFAVSAAETVKQFKRQFTIGRRSWPEVTNTLQDLYSARSQQVDAKYAAMSARMQLAFVGGEMDYLFITDAGAK
jgi:adhesin transport system outer membrane protein